LNSRTSTCSTLIVKSQAGAEFSSLLSADSPTPIHIHALLTQPLSGKCHTLNTLIAAKSRHRGRTHEPSATAENNNLNNNVQRHIFAADITVIAADPTDSADGGTASKAAAAAAIPSQACLKYATGAEEVAAIRREGMLYSRELAPLADVAVPRTYGFFTGGTEATPIACLVMDLCVSTELLRSTNEFWCVFSPSHIHLETSRMLTAPCFMAFFTFPFDDVCIGCVVAWQCWPCVRSMQSV
jgi:hypothetical protein